MSPRPAPALALVAALWLGPAGGALAQAVALTGVLGQRALLVVDGAGPRSLAVGDSWRGVRLLSLQGEQAEVEVGGRRTQVRLGEAPTSMASDAAGRRVVLQADGRGHFIAQGRINGQLVQFMVDTGATTVAIGAADAERLGLPYREGRPMRMATANGTVQGWAVRLDSVRIGTVDLHGMDAVVLPLAMPYVLLGNNVLARFALTRSGQQMVLEHRN